MGVEGYDWDKLGMTRAKVEHTLHRAHLLRYQEGVDFIKGVIARGGYFVLDAQLIPEREEWRFRLTDETHPLCVMVAHEWVCRAQDALDEITKHVKEIHGGREITTGMRSDAQ